MFLLDTHVVTELRTRERVDAGLAEWAGPLPPTDFYLSALSLLELETALVALESRASPRAAPLRVWLETKVLPAFAGRILPIDTAVARRCAALHVPNRRPERSALLAATALVHGLTVVTRHPADFAAMGTAVVTPWTNLNDQGQTP